MWYVYKIVFSNNTYYIGYRGTKRHIKDDFLVKYFSSSKVVKTMINQGFEYHGEILFECNDQEEAYEYEQKLIYENFQNSNLLNRACYFKRNGFGILSKSAKEQLSQKTKARWLNDTQRAKTIQKMKDHWTPEEKLRNSSFMKKQWTEERKQSHSNTLKGRPGHRKSGWKNTEEQRARKSKAMKGIPKSLEHRNNLSKAAKKRRAPRLEIIYEGEVFKGWKNFTFITGITKYNFKKSSLGQIRDIY